MTLETGRPSIKINSIAEGKNYEAQGFITTPELKDLAREAFLLGRIPTEEYYSFVHSEDNQKIKAARRMLETLSSRMEIFRLKIAGLLVKISKE